MSAWIIKTFQKWVLGGCLSLLAGPVFAAELQCTAHYIQLFATSVSAKANHMKITLMQKGFNTAITPFSRNEKILYRVRTGPYASRKAAFAAQKKMKVTLKDNAGVQNSIIVEGSAACNDVFPETQSENAKKEERVNVAKEVSKEEIRVGERNVAPSVAGQNRRTRVRFSDYKAPVRYQGRNHPLVMNRTGRRHKARLQRAIKNAKPSFAGHYLVTRWGCGAGGCNTGAVINAKTGEATPFPVSLSSVYPLKPGFEDQDGQKLSYRLDSRLMAFAGNLEGAMEGEGNDRIEFYEFKGGGFVFVASRPYGRGVLN